MKRIQYKVQLGYPSGESEGGSNEAAVLTVTAGCLVLRPERSPRLELTIAEVVEFKIDWWIPIFGQAIVVEHVAFEKRGTLVLYPEGISCRNLLREIEHVDFHPEATPANPWEPGRPYPSDDLDDVPLQQTTSEKASRPTE